MPSRLASSTSVTLEEPVSTVMIRRWPASAATADRPARQSVTLIDPARDVRLAGQAEVTQGADEDGQPGQAVGIEVAEDEDALVPVPRRHEPTQQALGIRQPGRIVEARLGRAEIRLDFGDGLDATAGQDAQQQLRHAQLAGPLEDGRIECDWFGQVPDETRFEHAPSLRAGASSRLHHVCTGRSARRSRDA